MNRYEWRPIGVFDRVLGREIRRTDPEWLDYEAAGASPDPMPPPVPRPIAERRREVGARVNGERGRILDRLTVTLAGYTFDAGTASYANLLGVGLLLVAGEPLPAGFTWRTVDNQLVPLTAVQVRGLVKAMVQARESLYRQSWALKDSTISASDNPEAIDIRGALGDPETAPAPAPIGQLAQKR